MIFVMQQSERRKPEAVRYTQIFERFFETGIVIYKTRTEKKIRGFA